MSAGTARASREVLQSIKLIPIYTSDASTHAISTSCKMA